MNPEYEKYEFSAFISYRRSDGYKIAKWLKNKLENYKLPKKLIPKYGKSIKVYLDKAYERATEDFWKNEINPALKKSRFLIVVSTPDVFKRAPDGGPNGVIREINKFGTLEQKDNIIVTRTSDRVVEDLPGDLNHSFPNMEIIDFQSFSSLRHFWPPNSLSLNDEVQKIIATLYDIDPVDMPLLKKEQERRTYKRIGVIFFIGIVVLLSIGWSAIVAQKNAIVAKRNEESALQAIENLKVNNAIQRISEDDLFGGLSWLSQTLEGQRKDRIQDKKNRVRFSSFLNQSPKLRQVIFHNLPVNYVEFSPDGKLIATAIGEAYQPDFGIYQTEKGQAQIWSVETGKAVTPPLLHDATVYSASFSPDGKLIVTASEDQTARIWDVETGRAVSPALKHRDVIRRAIFSPNGKYILCGGAGFTDLWEVATVKRITPDFFLEAAVWDIQFSPDSNLFAATTIDFSGKTGSQFLIWDINEGKRLASPFGDYSEVDCFDFSSDRKKIVVAAENIVRLWDIAEQRQIGVDIVHNSVVTNVKFFNDGNKFASVGLDGSIQRFNEYGMPIDEKETDNKFPKTIRRFHSAPVKYSDLSPDDGRMATISTDGTARVWDVINRLPITPPLYHSFSEYSDPDNKLIMVNRSHPGDEIFISFAPDGRKVAIAGWDGLVKIWDIAGGSIEDLVFYPENNLKSVSLSTDSKKAVAITDKYSLQAHEIDGEQKNDKEIFPEPDEGFFSAEYSPQGRFLIVEIGKKSNIPFVNFSGTPPKGDVFTILDAATLKSPYPVNSGTTLTCKPAFSTDDKYMAGVQNNKTLTIWENDLAPGPKQSITLDDDIAEIALSNGGSIIAIVQNNNTIKLIKTDNLNQEMPLIEYQGSISFLKFSHDNKYLVYTNKHEGRNQLTCWETDTGLKVKQILLNKGTINYLTLSPNKNVAVSAHDDGTSRVWDFVEGRPITAELNHTPEIKPTGLFRFERIKGVLSAEFSPDGLWIVTGGTDQTVRIWDSNTGVPGALPIKFNTEISKVRFSSDGNYIFATNNLGYIWKINFSPVHHSAEELAELTQILSTKIIDSTGNISSLNRDSFKDIWFKHRYQHPELFIPSPQSVTGWHIKEAISCQKNKNYPGQIFNLNILISLNPQRANLYFQRGQALFEEGKYEDAMDDFSKYVSLNRGKWQPLVNSGKYLLKMKKLNRTFKNYKTAIELGAADNHLLYDCAVLSLTTGDTDFFINTATELISADSDKTPSPVVKVSQSELRSVILNSSSNKQIRKHFKPLIDEIVAELNSEQFSRADKLSALYRYNQIKNAFYYFEQNIEKSKNPPTVSEMLYFAMILHKSGNIDDSKDWLESAEKKFKNLKVNFSDRKLFDSLGNKIPWQKWIGMQLLMEEAYSTLQARQ